jgi:hypothetical protein
MVEFSCCAQEWTFPFKEDRLLRESFPLKLNCLRVRIVLEYYNDTRNLPYIIIQFWSATDGTANLKSLSKVYFHFMMMMMMIFERWNGPCSRRRRILLWLTTWSFLICTCYTSFRESKIGAYTISMFSLMSSHHICV